MDRAETLLAAYAGIVERVSRGDDLGSVLADLARAAASVDDAVECTIQVFRPDHPGSESLEISSRDPSGARQTAAGARRELGVESLDGVSLGRVILTWPEGSKVAADAEELLAWTARAAAAAIVQTVEHGRLAASVALLEATLESTEDGILVVGDDGRIAGHNQRFAGMWNIDSDLLSSGDDARVIHSVLDQLVDPGAFVAEVMRLYGSQTEVSFDELAFKDGRTFERYSQPQLLDGRPVGRVWSFRDVTDKRQLMRQLQDSEDNLRRLVGQVRDYAIVNLDPTGHMTSWNDGAERITGYAEGEILGAHLSVFHREEDCVAGKPQQMLDLAVAQGAAEAEGWRVGKGGRQYWANVVVSPLYDDEGILRGFAEVTRDVSERRRADLALKEQAELLELMGSVATASNLAGNVEEALEATLAAFCKHGDWQLGHAYVTDVAEPGRLEHSVWYEATPGRYADFRNVTEELPAAELSLPTDVLESGEPVSIPAIELDPDQGRTAAALAAGLAAASAFPVLVRDQPVAVLEFLATRRREDDRRVLQVMRHLGAQVGRVVERERAERELSRWAAQLNSVLNSAADGIAGVDARGMVTFVNEAGTQLVGSSRENLVGRPIAEGLDLAGVSGTGTVSEPDGPTDGVRRVAGQHRRTDGSVFDAEIITAPIVEDGRVTGSVVVFRDVSERRAVDRMKEEFISVISHELRTPLTSVHGALGLLAGGVAGRLPAPAERMVALASSSTDRLVRLIDDLLDVERMAADKLTVDAVPVDAASLIVSAVDEMRGLAAAADVALIVDSCAGEVWADQDRIVQTLTNLIGNAVKFSLPGSTVRVATSVRDDHVRFDVRDEGPGIPEAELETVFERFRQVDASDTRAKGGTGLGLAICRGLVERHGGRIWATNNPGPGATFSFSLPSGHPTAPPGARPASRG